MQTLFISSDVTEDDFGDFCKDKLTATSESWMLYRWFNLRKLEPTCITNWTKWVRAEADPERIVENSSVVVSEFW